MPLKVLLVDDTPDRASALKAALTAMEGVEVACVLDSPLELLARITEHRPDVVVIGTPGRLEPIMRIAIERFEGEQALRAELEETKSRLAERKLVDRAKGLLMKHRGLDEDAAYSALRSLAMERGVRIGEAARQVIDVAALLA